MQLKMKKLYKEAIVPTRAYDGDAGLDLYSLENLILLPGGNALISTGIAIEIPPGYVGMVCPRSGLATKGITVLNAPGIVDSSYRGDVKVNLINLFRREFEVNAGMKIAQLVMVPFVSPTIKIVDDLSDSDRGTAGHGSSGLL